MKILTTSMVALSLFCGSAWSFTGNDWLGQMRNDRTGFARGFYMKGFLDASYISSVFWEPDRGKPGEIRPVCIPEAGTPEQAIRIVDQYLENNPGIAHKDFRYIAHKALVLSWPC